MKRITLIIPCTVLALCLVLFTYRVMAHRAAPTIPDGISLNEITRFGGAVNDVATYGNYAYVSAGRDLLVYDLRNKDNIQQVNQVNLWPADINSMSIHEDLLLASDNYTLYIIDISQPDQPQLISTFDQIDALIFMHALDGNFAYVLNDSGNPKNEQLTVIDLTQPTHPSIRGSTLVGPAEYMFAYANYVYVQAYFAGSSWLQIIDVSTLDARRATTIIGSTSRMYDVTVISDTLFIAEEDAIMVYDVQDPNQPSQIASIPTEYGAATYVSPMDGCACLLVQEGSFLQEGRVLRAFDISDPAKPSEMGSYTIPADMGVLFTNRGDFAFFVYQSFRFHVLDISGINNPLLRYQDDYFANVGDMAIAGAYAYVTSGSQGLVTLDISDPTTPQLIARDLTPGFAFSLAISGTMGAVAGEGNLVIYDLSNPALPQPYADFSPSGYQAELVTLYGDFAYTADSSTLRVVDLSQPLTPTLVYTETLPGGIKDLAVVSNTLYIAETYNDTLRFYDLSQPDTPIQLGTYTADQSIELLAPCAGLICLAKVYGEFEVLQRSSADSLTLLGKRKISAHYPDSLLIAGNRAYISAYDKIYILDISNPAYPLLLNVSDTGTNWWDIPALEEANGFLFAGGRDGLIVFDIISLPHHAFFPLLRH